MRSPSPGYWSAAIMRACLAPLLVLLLGAAALHGQTRSFTLLAGLQQGGAVAALSGPGNVDSSLSLGGMMSFVRSPETTLDIILMHQSSRAAVGDIFEPRQSKVDVTYLQTGGRYFFTPGARLNPYVAGTIGGARVATGGGSVVAFSFAGGVGAEVRLRPRLNLLVDGRAWSTLTDSASKIDCQVGGGGHCSLFASGSNFNQFTVSAGLVFYF